MLKHLEISNPNSCLNQSQEDEPVFTLTARDPLYAEIVREWAVRYIAKITASGAEPTERQAIKYHEALKNAELGIAWLESNHMRRSGDRRQRQSITDAPRSRCPTCNAVEGGPAIDPSCADPWHQGGRATP